MWGQVDQLMAFWVTLQHGLENPIIVEDDGMVFENLVEEGREGDNLEVRVVAGELISFNEAGQGILITGGKDLPDYIE